MILAIIIRKLAISGKEGLLFQDQYKTRNLKIYIRALDPAGHIGNKPCSRRYYEPQLMRLFISFSVLYRLNVLSDIRRELILKRILILAVALVSGGLLFSCFNTIQMANLQQLPTNYARSQAFDEKPVWRTAVLPPMESLGYSLSQTAGLYDYAGMALLRTGRFTVVDRSIVDQLLDEQEFSYSGVVDQATAVQLGGLLGAEAVMTINVTRISHDNFWDDEPAQRDAVLHVKLISVETSEILYTSVGQGTDFDGAEGALRMALEVALIGLTQ